MSVRRKLITFIVIALTPLLFFFNNCASKDSESAATAEVVVAKDIVGPLLAGIRLTTIQGKVQGWAMDSGNKNSILRVVFYINGDAETGTYLGETIANFWLPGPYEGHFFNFQVPPELIDGRPHPLYIYANEPIPENLIYPAPYSIVGYTPKAAEYYRQNIAPFIGSNNCVRCHDNTWNYESFFYGPLTNPYPISGGSPTNNRFYRKMSGADPHNGGAYCSGANVAFCNNLQAWWRAEFE